MCRFKSGIILKSRCFIPNYDSHSEMLNELNIIDGFLNASKVFVRAELIPKNNEWWGSPDEWSFVVDQDIIPDWFDSDKAGYEKLFRECVKLWWGEHVLIDKKFDELANGYYRLKRCTVKKLLNDVQIICDSSMVQRMYGGSTVQRMYDGSIVKEMYDSSIVKEICDSSIVQRMYGGSTVQRMYDGSIVQEMCDSSTVQRMYDSSTVQRMYDSSIVQEMCDSSIVQRIYGSSTVQRICGSSTVQEMYDSSTVQEMYDSSIARDYSNKKIYISQYANLEVCKYDNN